MNNTNDYSFYNLRTPTILTNSYVASTTILGTAPNTPAISCENQLILYVHFTKGSLTSAELIIEFSHDGTTNFVQETTDDLTASTGITTQRLSTRTFTSSGDYRIPIRINDAHIRVSVKGTGTTTGSLMSVDAIIGNN